MINKTVALCFFVLSSLPMVVMAQETKSTTDLISKQAREAREQTMRHASQLEKLKQESGSPTNVVISSNFKTSQEKLEIAMRDLKQRQLKRVDRLKQEVDQLLATIRDLGKKPMVEQKSPTPQMQVPNPNSGNVPTANSGSPQNVSENENPVQNSEDKKVAKDFVLKNEPVDDIALANNLVAIGSHDTAIKLLRKILKNKKKKLTVHQQTWVVYQLGVCYRAKGLYDEALRQFRIAANSKVNGITAPMAKWWIGQIDAQQKIANARNQIEAQIKAAGD